jgi:hypothetical protein
MSVILANEAAVIRRIAVRSQYWMVRPISKIPITNKKVWRSGSRQKP